MMSIKNIFDTCKKYGWILLTITATPATVVLKQQPTKVRKIRKIKKRKIVQKKPKIAPKAPQVQKSEPKKGKNYKKIRVILTGSLIIIGGLYFVVFSSSSKENNHDDKTEKERRKEGKARAAKLNKLFEDIFGERCTTLVEEPSTYNEFECRFGFGYREEIWNNALGNLQNISLEECKLNPDFLHANTSKPIDFTAQSSKFDPKNTSYDPNKKEWDTVNNTLGEMLKTIVRRLNFPANKRFSHWNHTAADLTCSKDVFLNALDRFESIMEEDGNYKHKGSIPKETIQMLNLIICTMHALDVGQNKAAGSLSEDQKKNAKTLEKLTLMIPDIMRECPAVLSTFIEDATKKLGLRSDRASTFTGKLYLYLQSFIKRQLDIAISTFMIRRYAHNKGVSFEKATEEVGKNTSLEHIINGFKKELSKYINTHIKDETSTYASFGNFTGDDKDNSGPVVTMFLQYFYIDCISPEKIVHQLGMAILNPYNPEISMNSYAEFAYEKGVIQSTQGHDTNLLYDNGNYEKLNKHILVQILFNTKIFVRK